MVAQSATSATLEEALKVPLISLGTSRSGRTASDNPRDD
jgi:hypothetical protein